MRTVLAFGTFDGIHEGHRAFFKEAGSHGDRLVVVIARDDVAEGLKGRKPERSLEDRMTILRKSGLVDEVISGDEKEGTWSALYRYRPEVVALGYDQTVLHNALEEARENFDWPLEIRVMRPFHPEEFHTAILRPRD